MPATPTIATPVSVVVRAATEPSALRLVTKMTARSGLCERDTTDVPLVRADRSRRMPSRSRAMSTTLANCCGGATTDLSQDRACTQPRADLARCGKTSRPVLLAVLAGRGLAPKCCSRV